MGGLAISGPLLSMLFSDSFQVVPALELETYSRDQVIDCGIQKSVTVFALRFG